MKTNLDRFYKTNSQLEKDGIWYDLGNGTKFLVKRFGGKNSEKVKMALAKHHKPYARLIEKGAMDPAKEEEIYIKVFVESCLVTWEGVEIDGEEKEFNIETAFDFFCSLPELANELMNHAQSVDNYREELGN